MLLGFPQDALDGPGYAILGASDMETACQICEQSQDPAEVLLFDVSMLGRAWAEVCLRFREINPRTRIILSSVNNLPPLCGRGNRRQCGRICAEAMLFGGACAGYWWYLFRWA